MTFRTRLVTAFAVLAVVPLVVIAIGVRREMDRRLTAQYQARVTALAAVTRSDLAQRGTAVADRLASLGDALADDDHFRLAAVQGVKAERPYLLDYAGRAMRLTGLSMLQIQDSGGRILSSGQFRNEYDRLEPDLPALLATPNGGAALVDARTPDGPLLVLARVDSVRLGGRRFTMIGGVSVGPAFLSRLSADSDLVVALELPDSTGSAAQTASTPAHDAVRARAGVVAAMPVPYIATSADGHRAERTAHFVISHPSTGLDALRRSVDRWFLAVMLLTIGTALGVAAWLAARLSRPLRVLADRTSRVDFERLDVEFPTGRDDEIGSLARLMNAMMRRLRASVSRVREAERRAAMGDLARQVNHDVKNGLAPIRHVLRHLAQVERDHPEQLAAVFAERRATLEASVAYLDTMARNYARLTPRLDVAPCDPNAVAVAVAAAAAPPPNATVVLDLSPSLPAVHADALVLRRILANLASNATDALDARGGTVTIATARSTDGAVRITVSDTGRGMTRDQLDHAFDDFYTTKPGGTGLGLSIVRRLVTDLHGTLRLDTETGAGTQVTVTLPASAATPAGVSLPNGVP